MRFGRTPLAAAIIGTILSPVYAANDASDHLSASPESVPTTGYDAIRTHPDGSVSLGRYLFVRSAMEGLAAKMHIGPKDIYTSELQDRMADEILKDAGLEKYRAGTIDRAQFLHGVAVRWDGMTDPATGKSLYGVEPGHIDALPRGALPYDAVRKEMEKKGYNPLALKHSENDYFCFEGLCQKYPEVLSCVAGGRPACRMAFVKLTAAPEQRYMLVITDSDVPPLVYRTSMVANKYDIADLQARQ